MRQRLDFDVYVEVGDSEYRINIIAEQFGDCWIDKAWLQYPDRSEDMEEVDYDVISMIESEIDIQSLVNEEYANTMADYGDYLYEQEKDRRLGL